LDQGQIIYQLGSSESNMPEKI